VRVYRHSERHEFNPGPCPKCGGIKHRVNWVDLGSGTFEGEEAIPGTVQCLNPACEWGPHGGVRDAHLGQPWEQRLPSR
jgi:hypothetical protein